MACPLHGKENLTRAWQLKLFLLTSKPHLYELAALTLQLPQTLYLKPVLFCLPFSPVLLSALFICPSADSVFTSKMQSRQMGASGKNMTKSTSIGGDMYTLEKNDGSQSDTAVGTVGTGGKKRRSSIGAKMVAIVGLSRKSRSTSQLSQTGRNQICFFFNTLPLKM